MYIDKEEPSRAEEDFGRIYRNLESRCVCVCFGVCVNNGDHVGSTRERKVGREVQVGSERGEKKFP